MRSRVTNYKVVNEGSQMPNSMATFARKPGPIGEVKFLLYEIKKRSSEGISAAKILLNYVRGFRHPSLRRCEYWALKADTVILVVWWVSGPGYALEG